MLLTNAIIDVNADFTDSIDEFTLKAPSQFLGGHIILKLVDTNAQKVLVRVAQMSVLNQWIKNCATSRDCQTCI